MSESSVHFIYDFAWSRLRPILTSLAWVDLFADQQEIWVDLMDDPRNLVTRVRVNPWEGIMELYYERYYRRTPFIMANSTFIQVANFDLFLRECPGFDFSSTVCQCDCFDCYQNCAT